MYDLLRIYIDFMSLTRESPGIVSQSLVCSLEDLSAPFRLRVVLAVQNDTEMRNSFLLQLMIYVFLCPKLNCCGFMELLRARCCSCFWNLLVLGPQSPGKTNASAPSPHHQIRQKVFSKTSVSLCLHPAACPGQSCRGLTLQLVVSPLPGFPRFGFLSCSQYLQRKIWVNSTWALRSTGSHPDLCHLAQLDLDPQYRNGFVMVYIYLVQVQIGYL